MNVPSLSRRRKIEKDDNERKQFLKNEFKATCVAKWEQNSLNKIEQLDIFNRASKFAEDDARRVAKKQEQIKDLYEREAEMWKNELEAQNFVSIEEKMEIIREKAERLVEKRQKEKSEFVKGIHTVSIKHRVVCWNYNQAHTLFFSPLLIEKVCFDRQWRMGCDEARALDALSVTEKMIQDRKMLAVSKEKLLDEDISEDKSTFMKELEQKEKRNTFERQAKNEETKIALDEQVRCNDSRNAAAVALRKKEETENLARWEDEKEQAVTKKNQKVQNERLRGAEVIMENKRRMDEREKAKVVQRREEQALLDYAIKREKLQIQKEDEKSQENKGAAQEYMNFLEEQMVKENEDTRAIDRIRDEKSAGIWSAREAEKKAKDDARSKLMADVEYSRKEQILEKKRMREEERRENDKQLQLSILEREEHRLKEKQKEDLKMKATFENMLANKRTCEKRAEQKARDKQQNFLEQEHLEWKEKEHNKRLDKLRSGEGVVQTHFPRMVKS